MPFFLPVGMMLLICALLQTTPFGNNTFLISDMNGQYIDYLAYLRAMPSNGNDFFYTFSKNMGGDMAGFSAYYLLSPLNILLFLFPAASLHSAVALLLLVKIGLCGVSFQIFISNLYGKNVKAFLFSTSYALMAYNVVYYFNIM